MKRTIFCILIVICTIVLYSTDLKEIKENNCIRHLGINYANFITGSGDGFSVELIQMFAEYLGVKYEFVSSDWDVIIPALTGTGIKGKEGDVICTGMTVLPWRAELVDFSEPTFPTQVWMITQQDSPIKPIKPSGSIEKDRKNTREKMKDIKIIVVENTCLDPKLYGLGDSGFNFVAFDGSVTEVAPAMISGLADAAFLDVAEALLALSKWPDKIKVIGPVSDKQITAAAFAKDSPDLKREFNKFLGVIHKDGRYNKLVEKYYPFVKEYFPEFFQ
ncbi:MAG: transporter substrate-binding domain-containing protein [Candidatus Cloacimonetes bacterium]|nr:transporter substrate-binding domain-containing protein [Candidatus Cloacimonadota bacterium]